jgi:hypothetical protein
MTRLSTIYSENRFQLFRIMLSPSPPPATRLRHANCTP